MCHRNVAGEAVAVEVEMSLCFKVVYVVGDLACEVFLEKIEAPKVCTIAQPLRKLDDNGKTGLVFR